MSDLGRRRPAVIEAEVDAVDHRVDRMSTHSFPPARTTAASSPMPEDQVAVSPSAGLPAAGAQRSAAMESIRERSMFVPGSLTAGACPSL